MSVHKPSVALVFGLFLMSVALGACPQSSGPGPRRAAASDGKYTIKFHRPLKVGARFKFITHATDNKQMEINGKVFPGETGQSKLVFESFVTIKAVDSQGKSTAEEHKVIRSSLTKKGKTLVPLAADTVVLAQVADGKEAFTVDGKPVSDLVSSFMGEIVDLSTENAKLNDDDIMGADGPKAPGDSWQLNGDKMLRRMASMFKNAAISPKVTDVSGTVRFVRLRKVNGLQGTDLAMSATINNYAPKLGAAVKVTSGSLQVQMKGWLPLDVASNLKSQVATLGMKVTGDMVKDGVKLTLSINFSSVRHRRLEPLP